MAPRKLRLFIPVYDGMPGFSRVLQDLDDLYIVARRRGLALRVAFVCEPSHDGTVEAATRFASRRPWARVRANKTVLGNSVNVMWGQRWGVQAGPGSLIACHDGDGEHRPFDLLGMIEDLDAGEFDGAIGTVSYPDHLLDPPDRRMMLHLGELQAEASGADGPFTLQSPGFRVIRQETLARAIVRLDEYRAWHEGNFGPMPRWGLHGVMYQLMGMSGARLHTVYLACHGEPPHRSAEKRWLQTEAAFDNLKRVAEFHHQGS